MPAATVRAQAKVNLFLRITGRETSGYHSLETLFCRLALADVVSVRLTSGSRLLECTGPALPAEGLGPASDNLAWRAATAYGAAAGWSHGFEITLEKHIPARAGLGGGSADAGAVLRALNALNPQPLAPDVLQRLAVPLGADVSFLTQDVTTLAHASGRGERWTALDPLPRRVCVLAIPPVGIATSDAYHWIDQARGWTHREVAPTREASALAAPLIWEEVARLAHNDFEEVVFQRFPDVAQAAEWLGNVVPPGSERVVLMSGSGAAIFALFPGSVAGRPALPDAPSGVKIHVTETSERVESVRQFD